MAYMTVQGQARIEIEIRKSVFIGHVAPATSEAAAWEFVNRIRQEHAKATHNCYAFRAGSIDRMSDDGEPSGTAGRPIFEVLQKKGLSDVACVVTRYFGGILLGAGGLVRAYTQAAAEAIDAAGVAAALQAVDLELKVGYDLVGKVQYLLTQRPSLTLDSAFGAEVVLQVRLPGVDAESFRDTLAELSSGRILVRELKQVLVGRDLKPLHG